MERRRLGRHPRILVVDDSTDMREMWCLWLETQGFSVRQASNGADALRQIGSSPPDLVLLDVMMPIMDGLETLRRLRADQTNSTVPVIMLSAQGEMAARRAYELGSNVFVAKPITPDDLMHHIQALLGR